MKAEPKAGPEAGRPSALPTALLAVGGDTTSYPFSDHEKAVEAGRKGAAAKKALAALDESDPDAAMALRFNRERAALTKLLLDAAKGQGTFAGAVSTTVECPDCGHEFQTEVEVPGLAPDKRLTAINSALAYAVGKPTARVATPTEKEKPSTGVDIE